MSTPQIDEAQIAEAAYFLWIEEGKPEDRAHDHWTRARALLETPVKPRKTRAKPASRKAAAAAPASEKKTTRARKTAAKTKA